MPLLPRAVFATLALLMAAGPLSAQSAQTNTPPTPTTAPAESPTGPNAMEDPQVGDHWTYEVRDEITGEIKSTLTNTVTDTSGSEIGMRSSQLGNPNFGYQTFDRSWNLVYNSVWRYTPSDGTGIRSPLAVGKTWSFKSTDTNSALSATWKRSGTAKVVAEESITTRAGKFDTFKIETSLQVQNANDPTKKIQVTQQSWYAPTIDHWVKRSVVSRSDGRVRDSSTIELIEYGRR
jgi:hypothetical protein